jgi:hypothetical protein
VRSDFWRAGRRVADGKVLVEIGSRLANDGAEKSVASGRGEIFRLAAPVCWAQKIEILAGGFNRVLGVPRSRLGDLCGWLVSTSKDRGLMAACGRVVCSPALTRVRP